jgi:hypothetical protein
MGLFDLFKKKNNPASDDENALETALRRASGEVAYRPEFYKVLLAENLVVLTSENDRPHGGKILKEGTTVDIVSFKDGKIPVFTSTNKIFDQGVIKEQVPFLEMKSTDLFNLAVGATFLLNPYSDYAKELLPHEVESILNGTILSESHRKIVVEEETPIQIGQPAVYPTETVNSLKIVFANRPEVNKAYLGWIYNPTSSDVPHLIFAIDAEGGDFQSIVNEAGFTAKECLAQGEIVDFMRIDNSDLSDYFTTQTEPFYERK